MISINKILKDKNFINKLSLLIFFIISWFSISTTFQNLLIFNSNETITINQLINFVRTALNIGIFPILLFKLVKMLIKTNSLNLKTNLIFFLSLLYFLSQSPALFYTSNSIENLIYVLSAINLLIIMRLSVEIFKRNELIVLVYTTFIILFFVLMNSFLSDVISFVYNVETGKRFYGSVNIIAGESYIRSSGASRIALILIIIYSTIFLKYINLLILKILPLFILSTIVFLYESRASVGLLIIFIIIVLFIIEKISYKNILSYLFFCLIFPWLISVNINYTYSHNAVKARATSDSQNTQAASDSQNTQAASDIIISKNKISSFMCSVSKCDNHLARFTNKERLLTSSGRIEDWNILLNLFDYKNNLFFGYGAQGDRLLINQTASNALIYSLISSGIVGFSFFLFFSVVASLYVIKFIFNIKLLFKNKNIDSIYFFSISTLMIILIRSLIESSYAVFGVDFILFFMSLFLVQKYNKFLK